MECKWTPASRSCDFVITRLISDQIARHKVQFPLYYIHFEITQKINHITLIKFINNIKLHNSLNLTSYDNMP